MPTIDIKGNNPWPDGDVLLAGPMVGQVGSGDVRIWVQASSTDPITLTVEGKTPLTETPTAPYGCVTFHISGLGASTKYNYFLNDNLHKGSFTTAPADSDSKVRICFGSCFSLYKDNDVPTFDSILKDKPDLLIMMGDNCYYDAPTTVGDGDGDLVSQEKMMERQLDSRTNNSMRALVAAVPTVAVWDDHDYGANDSDHQYLLLQHPSDNPNHDVWQHLPATRDDALAVFKRIWAQAEYGGASAGVYSNFRFGPVEVFLTDDRYHRVKQIDGDTLAHQVLGPDQLTWLINALKASHATIKLVVSGSAVLPSFVHDVPAHWEGYEVDGVAERKAITDLHIPGLIFISGDLHTGYLYTVHGGDAADGKSQPRFWEVVSSPLAHGPWKTSETAVHGDTDVYDEHIYYEFNDKNYGTIDVDLGRGGAEVLLQMRDENGNTVFSREVPLDTLQVHTPDKPRLSAMGWIDNRAYFFRNGRFIRYTTGDPGHAQNADYQPKKTSDDWAFSNVDGGYYDPDLQRAYLFDGNGYVRYKEDGDNHWALDTAAGHYPTYIQRRWTGFWTHDIDAVTCWPKDNKIYFFRDDEVIQCEQGKHEANDGYPKKIKDRFPHLPSSLQDGIDAVVVWSPSVAYFFKGDQYWRVSIDSETVDGNYPQAISQGFPDLTSL